MPDQEAPLSGLFESVGMFASLRDGYNRRLITAIDKTDPENPNMTDAQRELYFRIGAEALRRIVEALIAAGRPAPRRILDYPSGSGRVTRHLAAMFPDASVTAADLSTAHVEFCTKTFGTSGIVTPLDSRGFVFPDEYDVIFCGSLLTHLSRRHAVQVLQLIGRSLSPGGIALVTLHGRRSDFWQASVAKYLPDSRYRIARRGVELTGFGFVDYERDFRTRLFRTRGLYGIALTRPGWTLRAVCRLDDVRVLGYSEMAWDGHQDVLVFGKGVSAAGDVRRRSCASATALRWRRMP
jgi:SAM-dependent methyltransferase